VAISETYREVVKFLSEPKNLDLAFDLTEAFPAILDKFHIKFWENLKAVLEAELDQVGITDWVVGFDNDSESSQDFAKPKKRNTGESYQSLSISPKTSARRFCAFYIEQNFELTMPFPELWYGYGFNEDLSKPDRAKLAKESKVPIEEQKDKKWMKYRHQLDDGSWLACKDLNYKLRARRETVMLAEGDSLEREVAGALLDLFKQKRRDAEKINAALRQH
jgi:hypothetical protein